MKENVEDITRIRGKRDNYAMMIINLYPSLFFNPKAYFLCKYMCKVKGLLILFS